MWQWIKGLLGSTPRSEELASYVGKSFIIREGRSVEADGAFAAWTDGGLERMLGALSEPTNPIDRHFLLMGIVKETYRQRKDPAMAEKCAEVSELHLEEFTRIAPALKRDMGGVLPRVTTFQHYATLLTERGEFDRAVAVCELAMEYDLRDGTDSGFPGRIKRILSRKAKVTGGT